MAKMLIGETLKRETQLIKINILDLLWGYPLMIFALDFISLFQ